MSAPAWFAPASMLARSCLTAAIAEDWTAAAPEATGTDDGAAGDVDPAEAPREATEDTDGEEAAASEEGDCAALPVAGVMLVCAPGEQAASAPARTKAPPAATNDCALTAGPP